MKKIFKAIILGISNVIPGLCSATVALILGIYEELLDAIIEIKNWKKHLFFYLGIITGILIGIFIILFFYKHSPILLNFIFLGFVIRSYPLKICKNEIKSKKYILSIIGFCLVFSTFFLTNISFFKVNINNLSLQGLLLLAICGLISSVALILPGLSGALVLVILGIYYDLLDLIKVVFLSLLAFRIEWLGFINLLTFLGFFLIGLVLSSKVIKKFLNKNPEGCETLINGMILGTMVNIAFEIGTTINSIMLLIIGILLMLMISFVKIKK